MVGLHYADIAVIVVYLVGITALGVWMARMVKTAGDYFMPRKFGKAMMITHAFGTGTASDQAVTVAAGTFKNGISGIWWQWVWLPATPFYWLIAPIMRRFRAITTADVYALRYDMSVAVLFAIVGIANLSVKIGLLLKGSSELIHSCTGGLLDANWAIAIITVLFVVYGTAGGLGAAIITDFFQGILTVVFSFLLLPFVLNAVGGLDGIRETVQNPQMLSLVSPGKIGKFFIVMYSLQALVGIVAQPFIMGVCAAGRTEMDGRVGFMVGNIVKRICTMAWSITALAAVAWYLNRGVELGSVKADHVYGEVAREFLPAVLPGLLGLFIASLLAGVMSSCDSVMIASAGLFTENVYKPLKPGRSENHYLVIGRFASLAVVIGGVVFAYLVPTVISALDTWFKIAPMMGIAFWMGLVWRRATALGAWAATIAGFAAWWATTLSSVVAWLSDKPWADQLRLIWREEGKPDAIYDPWVVLIYMTAALTVGVVVSLCTKPTAEQKLTRFYALTRTPIGQDEVITETCTLPEGVVAVNRPMLCTVLGLEIPMPSKTAVVGFLAGWVAVGALVGGFVWLIS
ncbi:MAG: sodium:solute symporter family protein [Planctomycetales bacterium]|nr:sodium:solute symporter family protein [Planctomycetales bacterium]